jgi:hypothetical protein
MNGAIVVGIFRVDGRLFAWENRCGEARVSVDPRVKTLVPMHDHFTLEREMLAHACRQADELGLDDYFVVDVDSHRDPGSVWPAILRPSVFLDLPFLGEQAKRNILGLNAARLFNLDVPALT